MPTTPTDDEEGTAASVLPSLLLFVAVCYAFVEDKLSAYHEAITTNVLCVSYSAPPHIHATVVPIVTGERRKAKKKQTEGKRSYRKKANTVRLCADDVLTRDKLVAYHDSYAKAMEKYGLQRGVRGSEARHTTTAQYYRDLKRHTGELEANVQQLQTEQRQAEQQLDEVKREIKSEKLEAAKTEAKTALVAKVGSLFGSGKLKELEADNHALQSEVAARDERIELLQQQIEWQQEEHNRQLMEMQAKHRKEITDKEAEHQKKVSFLKSIISKAQTWFPLFQELVYMEKFCLKVGFNERQTATLISGKPLFYEGELYSEELAIKDMFTRFNEYMGASLLGNKGQLFVLETTERTRALFPLEKQGRSDIYTADRNLRQNRYRCQTMRQGLYGRGKNLIIRLS